MIFTVITHNIILCACTLSSSLNLILISADEQFSIPVAVNMIHVNIEWKELGKELGLSAFDIEVINGYNREEHRQRLIEKWYNLSVDQEFSRENLRSAMMKVSSRRESNDSERSIPSAPSSPTSTIIILVIMWLSTKFNYGGDVS